jgi:hypothetical protein
VAQILDWIFGLEIESTTASREFGEGGLCFKGGRSATVRLGPVFGLIPV